jgi:hypothetical protein
VPQPKPIREKVIVVLEDEAGTSVPFACRLRRFLKMALRSYGTRCKWVQDGAAWRFGDEIEQAEPIDIDKQGEPAA